MEKRERLCQMAKEWGATDFNRMLAIASSLQNIRLCWLAKEWGATEFNEMLYHAAQTGNKKDVLFSDRMGITVHAM